LPFPPGDSDWDPPDDLKEKPEMSLFVLVDSQAGQDISSCPSDDITSSSNRRSQDSQQYSYIGID
jgi:hypothetical protein